MPHQSKPGVNWDAIRERYEAGETPGQLSRSGVGVSRQAIQQKVNRLGWSHDPEKRRALASQKRWERKLVEPRADGSISEMFSKAAHAKDSPATRAAILAALEHGSTLELAAKAARVTRETVQQWKREDPDFAEMCEAAAAVCAIEHVNVIDHAGRETKDWKASDRMLQKHPMTKAEWGERPGGGGPNIQVVLNVTRGTAAAAALEVAEVITIEHEPDMPDGF